MIQKHEHEWRAGDLGIIWIDNKAYMIVRFFCGFKGCEEIRNKQAEVEDFDD